MVPHEPTEPNESNWRVLGLFGLIVSEMVVGTAAGLALGYGTSSLFDLGDTLRVALVTVGALLGLGLGFYRIFLRLRRK